MLNMCVPADPGAAAPYLESCMCDTIYIFARRHILSMKKTMFNRAGTVWFSG